MSGDSPVIVSAQAGAHEDLPQQLARHLAHPFRKPILDYNRRAFAEAMAAWEQAGRPPLVLDAGCGVGWSTLHLAQAHPGHFVLGVDQSADRLARGKPAALPENVCFIRADLVDFWRLLAGADIRLAYHYNLYPNPWPKIGHLGRRWHAHPVFPVWQKLGGMLECRSNWRIYIEEMAWALEQLSGQRVPVESWRPVSPITPFERKYQASGHALWRCRLNWP